MGTDRVNKISQDAAHEVLEHYMPLFEYMSENGIDYCLVGGMAVMVHALKENIEECRMTYDADILISENVTNGEMANAYIKAFALNPEERERLAYYAFGGTDALKELSRDRTYNMAIEGPPCELSGVDTPSVDICRMLNEKTLKNIKRETINIHGVEICVGTLAELKEMKNATISLLMADITTTSRPQDYADIKTIEAMLKKKENIKAPKEEIEKHKKIKAHENKLAQLIKRIWKR